MSRLITVNQHYIKLFPREPECNRKPNNAGPDNGNGSSIGQRLFVPYSFDETIDFLVEHVERDTARHQDRIVKIADVELFA